MTCKYSMIDIFLCIFISGIPYLEGIIDTMLRIQEERLNQRNQDPGVGEGAGNGCATCLLKKAKGTNGLAKANFKDDLKFVEELTRRQTIFPVRTLPGSKISGDLRQDLDIKIPSDTL